MPPHKSGYTGLQGSRHRSVPGYTGIRTLGGCSQILKTGCWDADGPVLLGVDGRSCVKTCFLCGRPRGAHICGHFFGAPTGTDTLLDKLVGTPFWSPHGDRRTFGSRCEAPIFMFKINVKCVGTFRETLFMCFYVLKLSRNSRCTIYVFLSASDKYLSVTPIKS